MRPIFSWRFEDLWQSPIGDVSHASNFRTAVRCDLPNTVYRQWTMGWHYFSKVRIVRSYSGK